MKRVGAAACRRDTMPGTTRAQAEAKVAAYQSKLNELLGPLSGFVHAFATAAASDGGEGATYLMLRAPRGGKR